MSEEIVTHGLVIDFGKHKGTLWTRVPVGYLNWLINGKDQNRNAEIARAELARRGTVAPEMDISGHAIDRASIHLLTKWQATRKEGEGIYSWLVRASKKALIEGDKSGDKISYDGMKFVFEIGSAYPVLKTIMVNNNSKKPEGKLNDQS